MDIETLAREASEIFGIPSNGFFHNGTEIAPGWTSVFNEVTKQSKRVLRHNIVSDYVVKDSHSRVNACSDPDILSGRVLGEVVFDNVIYRVRLPYFWQFVFGDINVEVQEFINGEACGCPEQFCPEHSEVLNDVSGTYDCHQGNWAFVGENEIVIFDFDGVTV